MSFDEQPDAPLHGECQQEIHRLEIQLADTEAELLEMRKERDDWAMKFINMCKQYAEIRWPGLDKEIKAI